MPSMFVRATGSGGGFRLNEGKRRFKMRAAILAIASFLVFQAWAQAQTHDRLAGTWKLVSVSSSTASGERNDTPFGPSPAGFLTYTQDGRMTAMISYGGRKRLSSSDSLSAPAEEQAEAFRTFVAYAGRYTLNGDKVIHHG